MPIDQQTPFVTSSALAQFAYTATILETTQNLVGNIVFAGELAGGSVKWNASAGKFTIQNPISTPWIALAVGVSLTAAVPLFLEFGLPLIASASVADFFQYYVTSNILTKVGLAATLDRHFYLWRAAEKHGLVRQLGWHSRRWWKASRVLASPTWIT